jgi:mycothiol synthase
MEFIMSENIGLFNRIDQTIAPDVQGLEFRGFNGESDYANILACIDASKDEDGNERSDTLEDVARYYAHLYNCDPYQDMIFAEVDGKVVGYTRVMWNLSGEGLWLGSQISFLMPEWRRKGIGRALLSFDEERLREIAAHMIETGELDPAIPCFFEAFINNDEIEREALLLEGGYEAVRHAYNMVRSLSEPILPAPLPEGLEVRPSLPENYRQIWDASQEAFRDHWGFFPAPEEEYQKWIKDTTFNPDLWQVAWDGDQVAGMVLNFLHPIENEEYNRKRGYTEGISVRRPWRRRGLARALLTRSLQMFRDMGMDEAALGVDTQNLNGALRLYESVGFRPVKRFTTYRKPLDDSR